MNSDDVYGFPSIELIHEEKSIVGRRVRVDPTYTTSHLNTFVRHFSGSEGTIIAHTPFLAGLTELIGTWYFTPDEGIGMVIPIDPMDVVFIDE